MPTLRLAACLVPLLVHGFVFSAQAAAPQVKTQAPGFHRLMLGSVEVTALYDGFVQVDAKLLKGADAKQVEALLTRSFQRNPVRTSVNAYLLNSGENVVLVDSGAGQMFGPNTGGVLAALRVSGYTPEQIDTVLVTHLHGDHIGGLLLADGTPAFPNAVVQVAKKDADFWLSTAVMEKAPKEAQPFFQMAQKATAPYAASGRLKPFEGEAELVPGIKPLSTPGPTPGHTSYLVESAGQRLILWGDLVHVAAVQRAKPGVPIAWDTDAATAVKSRQRVLAQASDALLAGSHLPFPGIGRLREEKKAYQWMPVEFAPLP